jgi:Tfp pilus assembly protein FimT
MIPHNDKNADGVTLWEVLISLAIATALITTMALPLVNSEKRQLYNAALALQQDIRYTRELALAEAKTYRLVLYSTYYKITDADKPVRYAAAINFINGVTVAHFGVSYINYAPDGATGDSGTITLRSRSGKYEQRVAIIPATGRVAIYP